MNSNKPFKNRICKPFAYKLYIYIYIYIERERERETSTDRLYRRITILQYAGTREMLKAKIDTRITFTQTGDSTWQLHGNSMYGGLSLGLNDCKSPHVSRILLSIIADLYNVVVWIISADPLISKSFSPFYELLGIVPRAPIIYICVCVCVCVCYLVQLNRSWE